MPSSPRTPRHSRHPSTIDLGFASPYDNDGSPRRYSKTSINTPTSPNHRHSLARSDSIGNEERTQSNGLGNLADELADAWDEDGEDEDPDITFQEATPEAGGTRDSGVEVDESPAQPEFKTDGLSLPAGAHGNRRPMGEYDGSDYGGDSDMESPGIPPGLVARMDVVESLARRGTESNGTERDGVVKRVIEELKDLGGQSGVEGGASRLITAHSALSTHLLHQTRLLQSLAYPLLSPLSIPPDEEFIEDLMPLLVTLNETMPRPTMAAFNSLTQLHAFTADLIQTINHLSDTLHMSRQTTTAATRRLKSARELVAEMRREEEAREEGERWLTKGNWSERLGARECAGVCGDVIGGFEEVCNGWRERLVKQAEAVSA